MRHLKLRHLRAGLMATTAMLMGLSAPVLIAAMSPLTALAQDYTSGALVGTVHDSTGVPVVGASVTLTSKAQGQSRTLSTSSAGSFSATGLAPGDYDVIVTAKGYDDYKATISVVISQEVRIEASLQQTGAATQTIVVKGKRVRQDFSKTTTGLVVDVDALVSQQPIARNLTAVTMLAPTVSLGNPGFGNVASFGGGSVAENAYYIDGLNITNPDTYVGSSSVPFEFYKTVEVKTGGYAAEFGRATGGVVNATTKSGTNDFMFAVHGDYQPMDLRADQLNTYANRGAFAKVQNNDISVEMGGPIIKDHLFAYGLYQVNDYESHAAAQRAGTFTDLKNTDPFLGIKLDGYITPTQHLSFTYFDTTNTNKSTYYTFTDSSLALNPVGDTQKIGNKTGTSTEALGGKSYVLNYSGKVTDWFSISAAYGDTKSADDVVPSDTSAYYVTNFYDTTGAYTGASSTISKGQPSTAIEIDDVERKFYRADGDARFDLLGHHHLRFGYDHEENSMSKISTLAGAQPVQYSYVADPEDTIADDPNPTQYLQVTYEKLGGNVSAVNSAIYLQDSWDITQNLNLQLGVRSDDFSQNNLSGEKYLNLKNNVAPRLGFSWDPTGEGVWKVYGSLGANYIPPAMNLGYRGKDLYYQEFFAAPAGGFVIDPNTGLPASVGAPYPSPSNGFTSPCPTSSLSSAPGFTSANAIAGVPACAVYGNGTQEGATSKTSIGLKATEEDEFILGTNYKANDLWSFGLSYTYRNLKHISEDSDFQTSIVKYLDANGLDSSQYTDGTIQTSYYVWNVGDHGVTIRLKNALPGEATQRVITLSADQLGHYHNPKRTYQAMVFDFRRAFDGKWGLQGSYTLSRSYGNYEGTVKSDVGNGVQTDAGATIAFDSPSFEDYGTGLLSNDHTHTFKLWGSYSLTPSFLVGANVLVQSPTHFSCLGFHPVVSGSVSEDGDAYAASYGPYSHFCDGNPAPLGKGLKSDWTKNIDISARYTVPEKYAIGGKLVLRGDIFNLFDTHSIVTRRVTYETTGVGNHSSVYGQPTAYNTPRYVRLGFDLSY